MKLSLNEASRTCRRSKSTLLEAIKSGKISAPKNDRGHYSIDPAELHRVFPFNMIDHPKPAPNQSMEPPSTTLENHLKTAALEREIDLLREMLEKAETNTKHWRSMAERQQALLEDKQPKGFLKRLLGR
jgi:hypothetical protein